MEAVYGLDILASEGWRDLVPNYMSVDHIHPADLTVGDVSSVTKAIIEADPRRIFRVKKGIGVIETKAGELKIIGDGESKIAFRLLQDNKSLVVLLQNGFNLDSQVPIDPKIYPGYTQDQLTGRRQYFFYSDARTYLSLGLPQLNGLTFGLHFQENLGESKPLSKVDLAAELIGSKRRKKQEIIQYVLRRNLEIVEPGDFAKSDHYFFPEGKPTKPAVIDILLRSKSH